MYYHLHSGLSEKENCRDDENRSPKEEDIRKDPGAVLPLMVHILASIQCAKFVHILETVKAVFKLDHQSC